jgi:hypothetical protein
MPRQAKARELRPAAASGLRPCGLPEFRKRYVRSGGGLWKSQRANGVRRSTDSRYESAATGADRWCAADHSSRRRARVSSARSRATDAVGRRVSPNLAGTPDAADSARNTTTRDANLKRFTTASIAGTSSGLLRDVSSRRTRSCADFSGEPVTDAILSALNPVLGDSRSRLQADC